MSHPLDINTRMIFSKLLISNKKFFPYWVAYSYSHTVAYRPGGPRCPHGRRISQR